MTTNKNTAASTQTTGVAPTGRIIAIDLGRYKSVSRRPILRPVAVEASIDGGDCPDTEEVNPARGRTMHDPSHEPTAAGSSPSAFL
jgi:hypothetical protein